MARPCRICGATDNPIFGSEQPCALFFGTKPDIPEGHYTLLRCRNCGDLYVDSDITEAYLNELLSNDIPEIRNKTTQEPTQERENIRTLELVEHWEMITKMRMPNPGDKLMDYGCAFGAFGNIAKNAGVIPNGVEIQPAAADFSQKLWGEGIVHKGSIESTPFNENEFDYVTSFETLEHIIDPIRILKEMIRFLKTDGVVAISVPSADYFRFKYWFYRKQPFSAWMRRKFPGNMRDGMVLIHNHLNTFSLDAAKLMMEKAGLRVIFISPYCSGLNGGRLGRIIKTVGKLLWLISFKKIAFAPSLFLVAIKNI
jgi:ubiquinone/menaquinone biosynthesis C-methylase UbiE